MTDAPLQRDHHPRPSVRAGEHVPPVALVTGAARSNSIAVGIVRALQAAGWFVVTSDLTPCAVGDGDVVCDLSNPHRAEALVGEVAAHYGPVRALILSQAHDVESGILDTTADSFDLHMAVNARASLLMMASFARQIPGDGGAIIALTSDHTTGNLAYGASKGALDRMVISAARELGPRGISANVLNPGPIDTGWMTGSVATDLAEQHPLGRLGTPQDVGDIVTFLVSDAGRWVSGQLLHADGGFSARF